MKTLVTLIASILILVALYALYLIINNDMLIGVNTFDGSLIIASLALISFAGLFLFAKSEII